MESNSWTPIDIANQALSLYDSVQRNAGKDVKYRLEDQYGNLVTVTPVAALKEMGTGNYRRWTGPYDEAEVDYRINRLILPIRNQPRTHEELMAQVKQVREQHIKVTI